MNYMNNVRRESNVHVFAACLHELELLPLNNFNQLYDMHFTLRLTFTHLPETLARCLQYRLLCHRHYAFASTWMPDHTAGHITEFSPRPLGLLEPL